LCDSNYNSHGPKDNALKHLLPSTKTDIYHHNKMLALAMKLFRVINVQIIPFDRNFLFSPITPGEQDARIVATIFTRIRIILVLIIPILSLIVSLRLALRFLIQEIVSHHHDKIYLRS